jgi:tRNA(Arg) A34 adenosine deaminase TadA
VPNPTETDIAFMRRTIALACDAVGQGHYPFAAILVAANDEILFEGSNMSAKSGDPHDHAEMYVLKGAARLHGNAILSQATLYASGEPCAMCAGTILRYGVGRVVFAVPEEILLPYLGNGSNGFKSYPSAGIFAVAGNRIEVIGGVLAGEAIEPFELWTKRGKAAT